MPLAWHVWRHIGALYMQNNCYTDNYDYPCCNVTAVLLCFSCICGRQWGYGGACAQTV